MASWLPFGRGIPPHLRLLVDTNMSAVSVIKFFETVGERCGSELDPVRVASGPRIPSSTSVLGWEGRRREARLLRRLRLYRPVVAAALWLGFRWLCRNHSPAAYVLLSLLRGLFSGLFGARR